MKNKIHIYDRGLVGNLRDQEDAYLPLLSSNETQTYHSLPHSPRKSEYLVTRGFLRLTLAPYLLDSPGASPRDIEFVIGPYGRPQLSPAYSGQNLTFNVSHCNDLVVCAIGRDCELGIDLEKIKNQLGLEGIITGYFSDNEIKSLSCLTGEAKLQKFYEYWTLKEAFIKATGKGHSFPVQKISFSLDEGQPIAVSLEQEKARGWQFKAMRWNTVYQVAIAVKYADDRPFDILFHS